MIRLTCVKGMLNNGIRTTLLKQLHILQVTPILNEPFVVRCSIDASVLGARVG